MHFTLESLDALFASRKVRTAASIAGAVILAALIFHAGAVYGERRAHGPFGPGPQNGFRVFLAPPGFDLPRGFIEDGHGAVGEVRAIASSTFTILTRDGDTKVVNATNTPQLRVGDHVLVVGEPDAAGNITVKIIKVLSNAPEPRP